MGSRFVPFWISWTSTTFRMLGIWTFLSILQANWKISKLFQPSVLKFTRVCKCGIWIFFRTRTWHIAEMQNSLDNIVEYFCRWVLSFVSLFQLVILKIEIFSVFISYLAKWLAVWIDPHSLIRNNFKPTLMCSLI